MMCGHLYHMYTVYLVASDIDANLIMMPWRELGKTGTQLALAPSIVIHFSTNGEQLEKPIKWQCCYLNLISLHTKDDIHTQLDDGLSATWFVHRGSKLHQNILWQQCCLLALHQQCRGTSLHGIQEMLAINKNTHQSWENFSRLMAWQLYLTDVKLTTREIHRPLALLVKHDS